MIEWLLFGTEIAIDRRKNWNTLEMKRNLIYGYYKTSQVIVATKLSAFGLLPVTAFHFIASLSFLGCCLLYRSLLYLKSALKFMIFWLFFPSVKCVSGTILFCGVCGSRKCRAWLTHSLSKKNPNVVSLKVLQDQQPNTGECHSVHRAPCKY